MNIPLLHRNNCMKSVWVKMVEARRVEQMSSIKLFNRKPIYYNISKTMVQWHEKPYVLLKYGKIIITVIKLQILKKSTMLSTNNKNILTKCKLTNNYDERIRIELTLGQLLYKIIKNVPIYAHNDNKKIRA